MGIPFFEDTVNQLFENPYHAPPSVNKTIFLGKKFYLTSTAEKLKESRQFSDWHPILFRFIFQLSF